MTHLDCIGYITAAACLSIGIVFVVRQHRAVRAQMKNITTAVAFALVLALTSAPARADVCCNCGAFCSMQPAGNCGQCSEVADAMCVGGVCVANTPTPTDTPTPTPTYTPTPTQTDTPTYTPTPTETSTPTDTPTVTPTPTPLYCCQFTNPYGQLCAGPATPGAPVCIPDATPILNAVCLETPGVCATITPTPTITQTPTVTQTPTPTQCGNGWLDPPEQCDDGNPTSGDTCPNTCRYTTSKALIRGHGSPPSHDVTGCQVEWYVAEKTPKKDSSSLPSTQQKCTDGDASCDYDLTQNGSCTFKVVVCLNNADPNLPACTPQGVGAVSVILPKARPTPPPTPTPTQTPSTGDQARSQVENALLHLLNPMNPYPVTTPEQTPSPGYINAPPLIKEEQSFCSAPFDITVPLAGARSRSLRLKTLSYSLAEKPKLTLSQLKLTCVKHR